MTSPPPPPPERVARYDIREARAFTRMLEAQPWLGGVLAALSLFAAAALVLGWVPLSEVRSSAVFRAWVGAILWLSFGAYVGVISARAALRRRG
jgi:hypothetical protein